MSLTPLKQFKQNATPEECNELAHAVGTKHNYLFEHLGKHRSVSIRQAAAIEQATAQISERNEGRTPVLMRDELVDGCMTCPYACAARKYEEGA